MALRLTTRGLAILGTAGALSAGCAVLVSLGLVAAPLGFSHRVHAAEGLECEACHAGATTETAAGMPAAAGCLLCHEGIDEAKPPERHAARLFAGEGVQSAGLAALDDEVRFSHAAHAKARIACAACHGAVVESDRTSASVRVGKDACMGCHVDTGLGDDCASCHATVRRETAPASHALDWRRGHGARVRSRSDANADRCTLCHAETACAACHQTEAPAGHTDHFRHVGHGLLAALDREACDTCHQPDACLACHQDTAPRSHGAAFGSPGNQHCVSCHLGTTGGGGCVTCHATTPSHALAAPQPAWHVPGMNCRQCHGVGAPLPHPDNGGNCADCHR